MEEKRWELESDDDEIYDPDKESFSEVTVILLPLLAMTIMRRVNLLQVNHLMLLQALQLEL